MEKEINPETTTNGSGEAAGSARERKVEELQRRFAAFRSQSRRRSPIPDDLRQAVRDAILDGVPAAALQRACGLSWSQLKKWTSPGGKAGAQGSTVSSSTSKEVACGGAPRVFAVNDGEAPRGAESRQSLSEDKLRLQIGRWSISVALSADDEAAQCCR